MFINTMDHARFGLLFLRNGKWKDQQLLSNEWVKASQLSSPVEENYGYMWWINADNKWKSLSSTVYYALGYGGNYIIIDEEHDLLVVARWMDGNKIEEVVRLIVEAIY